MNKFLITLILILVTGTIITGQDTPKILGRHSINALEKNPFSTWFLPAYENYAVTESIFNKLKTADFNKISFEVFYGTWCRDSRREIPRFKKLLDELDIDSNRINWVGVDNLAENYKRSPDHEELNKQIYRVPTFIVKENGVEIGRIIESPVYSLERDLFKILNAAPYQPNYAVYSILDQWLQENILTDKNIKLVNLASQINSKVPHQWTLEAYARVIGNQGKPREALSIRRINFHLYPSEHQIAIYLAENLVKDQAFKELQDLLDHCTQVISPDVKTVLEIQQLLLK